MFVSMLAGETSTSCGALNELVYHDGIQVPTQAGHIRQGRASAAMPAAATPRTAAAAGAARRNGGTGMECPAGTYYAVPGETRALV